MTRFQILSGLAVLIVGLLAVATILYYSSDSSDDEQTTAPSDQTPVAVIQPTPKESSQERQEDESPAEVVEQAPASVEDARTNDAPNLDRLMYAMRAQLEERGVSPEEIDQQIETKRKRLEQMDSSEWEAYLINYAGVYVWKWNPHLSDRDNRIYQKLYEIYGTSTRPKETPQEIIDVLVEGLDNLTAAQYLQFPHKSPDPWGWRPEPEYAKIYVDRALQEDPASQEALLLKTSLYSGEEGEYEAARRLVELYPDDEKVMLRAGASLDEAYPEEAIAALLPFAPKGKRHMAHHYLSIAYERLDMIEEAVYHNNLSASNILFYVSAEDRRYPSIWEERAAAELAETPQPPPPPESPAPEGAAPPPEPHDGPPPPTPPDEPPHAPADSERDLSDAYAQFAEAYRSAFEAEYGPPADTPEGRMNALLGIARAFAKAGDAEQAQAAYNEARKRYTREQVQEAFRRLDKAERLRRQQQDSEKE